MKNPNIIDVRQHETIKYRLRMAGSSLAEIAAELGLAQSTVSMSCRGTSKSKRVRKAIAAKLGVTVEALWPAEQSQQEGDM